MSKYALSIKAAADLQAIPQTSLQQWRLTQAERDIHRLHATFQSLAAFPDLGRDAADIRPGTP